MALALGEGAQAHHHRAVQVQFHRGGGGIARERRVGVDVPGLAPVVGAGIQGRADADADQPAFLAGFRLLLLPPVPIHQFLGLCQHGGEVAGIIDAAVRRLVRELLDIVLQAHLVGGDTQFMAADVYHPFHEPDVRQPRVAAVGRGRALVGGHLVEVDPDIAQLVGRGQHLGPYHRAQGFVAGVGADVVDMFRADPGNDTVTVQRDFRIQVDALAAAPPGQHVAGAGFYPFHRRAVQFFRGQAGQGQVRVIADLVAETAADIVGAQADLVHADAQRRRQERQRHRHDGVGEQVNLAALVPGGDTGIGFDGGAAETVEIQLADFDHVGGVRKRLVHVAVFVHAREYPVGTGLVVEHGLVRQGLLGVQHHVQRFVFHVHKLGRVLGNGN